MISKKWKAGCFTSIRLRGLAQTNGSPLTQTDRGDKAHPSVWFSFQVQETDGFDEMCPKPRRATQKIDKDTRVFHQHGSVIALRRGECLHPSQRSDTFWWRTPHSFPPRLAKAETQRGSAFRTRPVSLRKMRFWHRETPQMFRWSLARQTDTDDNHGALVGPYLRGWAASRWSQVPVCRWQSRWASRCCLRWL